MCKVSKQVTVRIILGRINFVKSELKMGAKARDWHEEITMSRHLCYSPFVAHVKASLFTQRKVLPFVICRATLKQ